MRYSYHLLILLFVVQTSVSQSVVRNVGNLKLHQKGSLGFHTDLINDGSFDRNLGLIGFYKADDRLLISGAFSPTFHNFEVAVEDHLYLEVPVNIENSLHFIYGDIKSERSSKSIYSKFNHKSYYQGESDLTKIDGYVTVEGQKEFRFPVGQGENIKPLHIKFIDDNFLARCGYFMENPDFPHSLASDMDTSKRDPSLSAISSKEFWLLSTSGRIQLTLSWDSESNISESATEIQSIVVAGWSKHEKMWVNLGNASFQGDLAKGEVTSNIFNANDYEYFTHGFLFNSKSNEPGNYALSPNGDGINDFFTLAIIDQSPNNDLKVYNRAGQLVYEKSNYKDEFRGMGNRNIFRNKNSLPEGVYFYLLELKDINKKYQGYFYLVTD
ncbi:MAG: gliding motility-associated C-terminal domain-containing protein [Flavobacteriaceae bacterium]